MKDLPKGSRVQIVKKSTKKSMFDIYANPINNDNPDESVIKLRWNTVEYGGTGQSANASAHANMDFETGVKIAKDILGGHPFAAKKGVLKEVEKDLGQILTKLKGKADKDAIQMLIENAMSDAITKAYLYPNRIRETWEFKQDNHGNDYYRCSVSGGGQGKIMLESRYVSIEAREYNGKLQYHVTTAITQGQRGQNGRVTAIKGKPVTRAKTIVSAEEMVEAMEKLLLFIQGSVTYDVAKGSYRPFTVSAYQGQPNNDHQGNTQQEYTNERNQDPNYYAS